LLYVTKAGLNYPDLLARLNEWDGSTIYTAKQGMVRLPVYDKMIDFMSRSVSKVCEKTLKIWHHPITD
jgi:hypothetical protein